MPGLIRASDVEEVKARTDLAEVIGEHVALKPAGVGSLKGLCPFHDERTPSFHVRPAAGFYHCFGCGESGDVYTFLRRVDHLTFSEAVERLAARAGLTLHYEDGRAAADTGQRARALAALAEAERFYSAALAAPDAEPARRFLAERGFDREAAARFGVGYAPQSWSRTSDALRGRGFTDAELAAAGLTSAGERGAYDRFRGRLVWPIRDVTGQTVGFGARRLADDDTGPKYLNTPETALYHKAQLLYGLDLAKRDISRSKRVVVVEGYTDVMACHLAGVTTAVATCGTSFGADHVGVLRRVLGDDTAAEVVFTFDPDEAGRKAAERAFAEHDRFSAQTFVATGPEGLDPCDLRLARGDEAVRRMVEGKQPLFAFMIRQLLAGRDLDTAEGRLAGLRAAAPVVAGIRDRALQPAYVRELARLAGTELGEAQEAVRQAARRGTGAPDASRSRGDERRVGRAPVGTARGERTEDAADAAATGAPPRDAPAPPVSLADLPRDPAAQNEIGAVAALLQFPSLVPAELLDRAVGARVASPALQVVLDGVAAVLGRVEPERLPESVAAQVPEALAPLVRQLTVMPLPVRGDDAAPFARGMVAYLVERGILAETVELASRLRRTDPADGDARRELQRRLGELDAERRRLRS